MCRFYILCSILCMFFVNQPVYSAIYNPNQYSLNKLSNAELKLFGRKNNPNLNPYARLARAEQRLFGTVQSGDFDTRVKFLNQVLDNSNRNRVGYYDNQNKLNRLRYVVNDLFNGSMTGYTPPVYNSNRIPGYGYYNTTIPMTPYVNGNRNFITQTRVIIDDN